MGKIFHLLKADWYKYLLEILVITFGILGAYALNNWNEYRKDREREDAILKQLQTEFQSNLDQLDEKIGIRDRMFKAAMSMLGYIDRPEDRRLDSINYHLAWTIPYATFDPIINDLASSGSLRIIESDSLKQLLSFWTSEIVQVTESEDVWTNLRNNQYVPFVIKHYQLRTMRNSAMKTNLMQSFLINQEDRNAKYKITEFGETRHDADYNRLLDHPDYEDHLVRLITNNRTTQQQSYILRQRIEEILSLIEHELVND